jgi:hypothetical protein
MNKTIFWIVLFSASVFGCAVPNASINKYEAAPMHKAFAVSINGVVGDASGLSSSELAIDQAISVCAANGGIDCKVVDINGSKATLYGPYSTDPRVVSISKRSLKTGSSGEQSFHYTCSDITKSFAYALLSSGHSYLDKDGDGNPCEWGKTTYTPSSSSSSCHWVSGYRRKSGTYVKGYRRCR